MRNIALIVDDVAVDVIYKKIKNMNLRVYAAEGRVRLAAPLRVSQNEVLKFVNEKLPWIKKHLQDRSVQRLKKNAPLNFSEGEIHYYQARKYCLQVVVYLDANACFKQQPCVIIKDHVLQLFIKQGSSLECKHKILDTWYSTQLKYQSEMLIAKYEPIMAVKVGELRIKKMKTRWGSCNIEQRRIWLNFDLIKKDPILLEYVVVHEMVHLLEASHNPRFKSLMDRFMPQWRQYKQDLNNS